MQHRFSIEWDKKTRITRARIRGLVVGVCQHRLCSLSTGVPATQDALLLWTHFVFPVAVVREQSQWLCRPWGHIVVEHLYGEILEVSKPEALHPLIMAPSWSQQSLSSTRGA